MTFSIVARCSRTGALGVAVSTAVPAVGAMCMYLRTGVGRWLADLFGVATPRNGQPPGRAVELRDETASPIAEEERV